MGVEFKGLDKLQRRLKAIQDGKEILGALALDTVRYAKEETRPFRKTGNLGRTINVGRVTARDAYVIAHANYAVFVEKGTGIYGPRHRRITPKTAKVLAWRTGAVTLGGRSRVKGGKELAGWAFATSVRGRKATPFMEPGARRAAEKNGMKDVVITLWNKAA